jgi:hypothetical protein
VARLFPYLDRWRWEIRIGKTPNGNRDGFGKSCTLPLNGRAASRAEVEGQFIATFGGSCPRCGLTSKGDLIAMKARLIGEYCSCAALTFKAVTHRDARWFTVDGKMQLTTTACRNASRHKSPQMING